MQIFRFDPSIGANIDMYASRKLTSVPILRISTQASIHCLYLEDGGVIGFHTATENQLFLVVSGEGEVCGESREYAPIQNGEAAFWRSGEGHATRTDTGLTAIVVEGQGILPVLLNHPSQDG